MAKIRRFGFFFCCGNVRKTSCNLKDFLQNALYDGIMKKIFRKLIVSILVLVMIMCAGACAYGYMIADAKRKEVTAVLPVAEAVRAYEEKEGYVPYGGIDPDFVNAVVAVEDKRYFERTGYDFIALARAVYNNIRYGGMIEGGSTIPEQIAKNLYFGPVQRDLDEKLAEILIMYELEERYTDEELFALYANMNYYGDGYYGIRDAAYGYYGKDASELTVAEAAILAGLPNAPGVYQLSTGFEYAKKRQKKVLQCMKNNGYITESEYQSALEEDVSPR